jgi:hypothetical protein
MRSKTSTGGPTSTTSPVSSRISRATPASSVSRQRLVPALHEQDPAGFVDHDRADANDRLRRILTRPPPR